MAKKYEFKPDRQTPVILSKLFLTPTQRQSVLKWGLYTLVLLVLSVLQDVLLCKFRLYGATTELVPCGIFLICLAEDLERSSIFSLCAACIYLFSGTAAGYHSIVLITALCVGVCFFRQNYLRKGFSAGMLCTVFAVFAYELAVFAVAAFLGQTTLSRIGSVCITALLTLLSAPILYPIVNLISTIGGQAWKE